MKKHSRIPIIAKLLQYGGLQTSLNKWPLSRDRNVVYPSEECNETKKLPKVTVLSPTTETFLNKKYLEYGTTFLGADRI